MQDERKNWERLQQLFHLAEGMPEERRESVLREQCDDPGIVARVLDILRSYAEVEEAAPRGGPAPQSQRVGPYTLLQLIGSGGLGTVYLAERIMGGAPHRSALKVLAPHAAGPRFVERFHREQHILASLDHPRIAKLLDAGMSESGQPYFVMEYVRRQTSGRLLRPAET